MSEIKDGGPAFPMLDTPAVHLIGAAAIMGVTDSAERDRLYTQATARAVSGMTLRDYFAAKALIGLITEPIAQGYTTTAFELTKGENIVDTYAMSAYKFADAMLAARGGK